MIQCEVDVCSIDHLPKDQSEFYELINRFHPEIAPIFLYQVLIPRVDDE
jgi:hypothetical protein